MNSVLMLQMLPAAGINGACSDSDVSCESHLSCVSQQSCWSQVSQVQTQAY